MPGAAAQEQRRPCAPVPLCPPVCSPKRAAFPPARSQRWQLDEDLRAHERVLESLGRDLSRGLNSVKRIAQELGLEGQVRRRRMPRMRANHGSGGAERGCRPPAEQPCGATFLCLAGTWLAVQHQTFPVCNPGVWHAD